MADYMLLQYLFIKVLCYAESSRVTHQYSIASSNKPDNCSLSS